MIAPHGARRARRARPLGVVQHVVRSLALDILAKPIGARLPTTAEYQRRLQVGSGSAQKALHLLVEAGAVRTVAQGNHGTFVRSRDPRRLWRAAELGPVRIVMTPPGAAETYGLAAGLQQTLADLGLPHTLQFERGAQRRVCRLLSGEADLVVVSRGAADSLCPSGQHSEFATFDAAPVTYYAPDSIVAVRRQVPIPVVDRRLRIGLDWSSYDHRELTLAEFGGPGPAIEYVECDFLRIPHGVMRGTIDVGLWHVLQLIVPLDQIGLTMTCIRTLPATRRLAALSGAVLVARSCDVATRAVLTGLDLVALRDTQIRSATQAPFASDFSWLPQ